MLYFCVRKVQFALSIELKKNTSFGLLHLSHWRLDLFCSWKMEWSHGKVMEKSLNFIPNFQYEPCFSLESCTLIIEDFPGTQKMERKEKPLKKSCQNPVAYAR